MYFEKTDMWQNKHDILYLYRQIESRDIAPKRRHKKERKSCQITVVLVKTGTAVTQHSFPIVVAEEGERK